MGVMWISQQKMLQFLSLFGHIYCNPQQTGPKYGKNMCISLQNTRFGVHRGAETASFSPWYHLIFSIWNDRLRKLRNIIRQIFMVVLLAFPLISALLPKISSTIDSIHLGSTHRDFMTTFVKQTHKFSHEPFKLIKSV